MKPLVIIIPIIIVVIFGLLATEVIDLRPDSTGVRKYEDLKQNQNEWIAENCVDEKCNDGKTIEEKIREFIEINRNVFDENGFNIYGFNKDGLDKHGRTIEQGEIVGEAYKKCIGKTAVPLNSGGLSLSTDKSAIQEYCNQQSRLLNEQFKKENNP